MTIRKGLRRFLKSRKAQGRVAIMAIIIGCITVAIGSAVGLTLTAKTEDVFWKMKLSGNANTSFSDTVATIYTSWPMLGLVILALIGAGVLVAIAIIS